MLKKSTVSPSDPSVTIKADHRERSSGILERLAAMPGVTVEVSALEIGDYHVHPSLVVERKSAGDFLASILDRRLFEQAKHLRESGARAVILIEGNPYTDRRLHENAVVGALSYLVAIEEFSVIPTAHPAHTAFTLHRMALHAQHGLGYTLPLRCKKPASLADRQRFLLEGAPGLGPERITALLKHFGSPRAIFAASREELMKVEGIGKGTVDALFEILDSRAGPA